MWTTNAITFATSTSIGTTPNGMFIDIYNNIYVADRSNSAMRMWLAGSTLLTKNITLGLNAPYSLFVTIDGDIYIDNGGTNYRVDRWSSNGTLNRTAMILQTTSASSCYGLFIDIMNNLYCSMNSQNMVAMKSLNSNLSLWTVAAGVGCTVATSNTLSQPRGIFVDTDLNLYVADCGNNRIQLFPSNQTIGITVAGTSTIGTIILSCPSGVVLDGNNYMFIVDTSNHRIIGSGSNGFRCIIGCDGSAGSASNQLYSPTAMSFDSYGNIYVVDSINSRIQKFSLISDITSRK